MMHLHPHRALARARPCRRRRRGPVRGASSSAAAGNGREASGGEMRGRRPRIVVAMSGGVDSSVAAHLLQRRWGPKGKPKGPNDATAAHAGVGNGDMRHTLAGNADDVGDVEVVGLHMSNWNALDEDPDGLEASAGSSGHGSRRRGTRPDEAATQNSNQRASIEPPSSSSGTTFCEASEQEYNDARAVASHLSLPLHRASFAAEYWVQVFEPFVEGIAGGSSSSEGDKDGEETTMPNPDFGCNAHIKFGAMREYAKERLGAEYIATGHYAQLWHREYTPRRRNGHHGHRTRQGNGFYEWMEENARRLERSVMESIADRPEEEWILSNGHADRSEKANLDPLLLAGADRTKDQSYFLSGVKSEAFRNVIFPLGHLSKGQAADSTANEHGSPHQPSVRDMAREAGMPTASKKDSMGICFVGKRNFGNFVAQYLPEPDRPGNFIDVDSGAIVGRHGGALRYTIGQGAKISGANVRYFVCGKGGGDVFVCNDTHHPALYTDELRVDFDAFNWIGLGGGDENDGLGHHIPRPLAEGGSIQLLARTRHLQPLAPCTVTWAPDSHDHPPRGGQYAVRFERPMRAVTPGQILALYAGSDGLICLGGGPIRSRGPSLMERGVVDIASARLHPSGHNDLSLSRIS